LRILSNLFPIAVVLAASGWAAEIRWNFDGGNLQRVEKVAADHFRVLVNGQTDQDGRNRQASWYYFRVDGASRTNFTIDIAGLPGEYNYQPNRGAITKDTPPLISYDEITWKHVDNFEYDAAEPRLRLRIQPQRSRFWIAHTPPYINTELARLRKTVARHPDAHEQVIGKSVEGRDLLLWSICRTESRKTVWLMFRQHAWESGSSWAGDGAVRALLTDASLRDQICWKILPFADPDGVASGGVRFNRHGYDLNRNWDVTDPKIMPEIEAQRAAIRTWLQGGKSIDFFLSLHNTETGEYLEGPPGPLADDLFRTLREQTTFHPSRPFVPVVANRDRGRANVIQSLGAELKVPAFLMEQRIAFNEKLKHRPNIADRTAFGRELVRAIHDVLLRN
jgi:hypothetical protein